MMGDLYRIRLLSCVGGGAGTVAMAYVLAAAADPHLTRDQWTAFVRRCGRQAPHRGGLGVLEDRRGYVHAVFRYAVGAGPTMWLLDVVLGRLPGGAALCAIAAAGELMARAFGCAAVAVSLPAPVRTILVRALDS